MLLSARRFRLHLVVYLSAIAASPGFAGASPATWKDDERPDGAKTTSLSDLAGELAGLDPFLGTLRKLTAQVGGSLGEGLRRQIEALLDEKVEPLLMRLSARLDALAQARIGQVGEELRKSIKEAERALNATIELMTRRAYDLAISVLEELARTTDLAISRLDQLVCRVAPDSAISLSVPLLGSARELTIKNPAETQCWNDLAGERTAGTGQTFKGLQYQLGMMCELEEQLWDVQVTDPKGIERARNIYSRLSEMASAAVCLAPTDEERDRLRMRLSSYARGVSVSSRIVR